MTAETAQKSSKRSRGIDRAMDVLEYLRARRHPASIGDIAQALAAPRSSLYEIINRLVGQELLERQTDGNIYFGRAMHFYGACYLERNSLMQEARGEVSRLATIWGETVQFSVLDGNKYTVALMDTGTRTFRISSEVGTHIPLPWTASGRLLLGHMSDHEVRQFVPKQDYQLTDGRTIDMEQFLKEVRISTAQGFCITEGLVDNFTTCMAVPVCTPTNRVAATICFVVIRDIQISWRNELLDALTESARRLSNFTI